MTASCSDSAPDVLAGDGDAASTRKWAIVLAGGEGTRLQSLTTSGSEAVPKQFCALRGEASMLHLALERAARIVLQRRIAIVVAAEHRPFWSNELAELPADNVLVQPRNRGTAAGVLLALLHVLDRDPGATVLVLPADHDVADEQILTGAVRSALGALESSPRHLVLLGAVPERAEEDFGWILPDPDGRGPNGTVPVSGFREKPPPTEVEALIQTGAMINTFIFTARVLTLLGLYGELLPELAVPFADRLASGGPRLESLYDTLPHRDFSRDLLERARERLLALAIPPCGWSDLGTPERVARCLAANPRSTRRRKDKPGHHGFVPPVDLSRRIATL